MSINDRSKPVLAALPNPSHPLSSGLVACWRFLEGGGNIAGDSSGHGNHGILSGTAAWGSAGGLKLDRTSAYVQLPLDVGSSLRFLNGPRSFAVWVRFTGASVTGTLIDIRNHANTVLFKLAPGGANCVYQIGTTGPNWASGLSVGPEFLIVGTYDLRSIRGYSNGVLRGTNTLSTAPVDTYLSAARLGCIADSETGYADGIMWRAACWARALSQPDIDSLYADPDAMFRPSRTWMFLQPAVTGTGVLAFPPGSVSGIGTSVEAVSGAGALAFGPGAIVGTGEYSEIIGTGELRFGAGSISGRGVNLAAQAAVRATYQVMADWNGNGGFDSDRDDITDLVEELSWGSGRDYASQLTGCATAGWASVKVENPDGLFSSFNSNSPLYGRLLPGRAFRITMTVGSKTTMFQGTLDSIEPLPDLGGQNVASIRAVGVLASLQDAEVSVEAQTNVGTGAAVGKILDAAGWPAEERLVDAGITTMVRWWTSHRVSALTALRDVEETECGFLRETKDGKVAWEDRHHRLKGAHLSPVARYSDAYPRPEGTLGYQQIRQMDPLKEVYNSIQVEVETFTVGALAVLWSLSLKPVIAPGQTLALWATPSSSEGAVGVDAWTTPEATTDYTANTAEDGSGTDLTGNLAVTVSKFATAMKMEIKNNGAVNACLTKLDARGTPVIANDPIPVSRDNEVSQGKYGLRAFPSPGRFIPDLTEAGAHLGYLLSIYSDPIPVLTLVCRDDGTFDQLLDAQARDVSERVHVTATGQSGLGIDQDFFVEAIRHRVSEGGTQHVYEMDLSPTTGYGGFWVLGSSKLGVDTKLGY